ncbi:MAG TPA: nucleotidyltransferase substrate binding protein [Stellaceae bacterium]|jgi:hypothetical protein|nr:nucleotidyltransferase substrate binding protein [Stellaceae bacterium]
MPLDTTPLANAVQRLREGLAQCAGRPDDELLRDGLLQRFKFTYEASRQALGQRGAAPSASVWRGFGRLRRQSNGAFDAKSANEIIAELPAFIVEVERLIAADRRPLGT